MKRMNQPLAKNLFFCACNFNCGSGGTNWECGCQQVGFSGFVLRCDHAWASFCCISITLSCSWVGREWCHLFQFIFSIQLIKCICSCAGERTWKSQNAEPIICGHCDLTGERRQNFSFFEDWIKCNPMCSEMIVRSKVKQSSQQGTKKLCVMLAFCQESFVFKKAEHMSLQNPIRNWRCQNVVFSTCVVFLSNAHQLRAATTLWNSFCCLTPGKLKLSAIFSLCSWNQRVCKDTPVFEKQCCIFAMSPTELAEAGHADVETVKSIFFCCQQDTSLWSPSCTKLSRVFQNICVSKTSTDVCCFWSLLLLKLQPDFFVHDFFDLWPHSNFFVF